MELKPFKEMIALTKEKLDEAMVPIFAKMAKGKAEVEKAKLESEILTKTAEVQALAVNKEIDFTKLLDKLDEISLLERRLEQYGKVLSQLFPEEAK